MCYCELNISPLAESSHAIDIHLKHAVRSTSVPHFMKPVDSQASMAGTTGQK